MHQNNKQLRIYSVQSKTHTIGRVTLPEHFSERVLVSVEQYEKKHIRIEWTVNGSVALLSFVLFFFAGMSLYSSVSSGVISNYLSLVGSDFGTLVVLWKEIGLLVLESIPVFGVSLAIFGITAFLWSLLRFSKTRSFIRFA